MHTHTYSIQHTAVMHAEKIVAKLEVRALADQWELDRTHHRIKLGWLINKTFQKKNKEQLTSILGHMMAGHYTRELFRSRIEGFSSAPKMDP
jgi:hypothetical protein